MDKHYKTGVKEAKAKPQFTKDNEYYTPRSFIEKFGAFDYDPATTLEKSWDLNIPNFDTVETDGLSKDWTKYKRIWINPPFTLKHVFLKKAVETYNSCKNEIYVLFPIEFMTTKQFCSLGLKAKVFIPNGRINFESGLGKKGKSPAFGSVVIKLQDLWEVEIIDK